MRYGRANMKSRESSAAIRHDDFRPSVAAAIEQASLLVSFLAAGLTIAAGLAGPAPLWVGVGVIAGLSGLYAVLASWRQREWLLHAALASLARSHPYYRAFAVEIAFL